MGMIYRKKGKDLKTGKTYEGKIWWIKYYRHGKAYRESTGTDKKTAAEILLKQREGEIAQGKVPGVYFDKVQFDDLAKDFLTDYRNNNRDTLQKAERSVKYLGESFSGVRVTDITTDRIRKYTERRIEAGLSNASINRELAALKRMFTLGKQAGKVNEIPYIPMLKESNVREGFFEYEEFVAVRDALPHYLKPFITFAYYTGCRVDEIRNLKWSQVDLKERIVTLNPMDTKTEKGRHLYLDEDLLSEMKSLSANRHLGCPYVFHRDGHKIKDFRAAWKGACIRAGLWEPKKDKDGNVIYIKNKKGQKKIIKMPTKLFHDLRRTGVREMVRSGIPEQVAMKISGHKTRSVFDRYNIVSEDDLKEAARAREERLNKQKATAIALDANRGEIKQFKQAQTE
jgi:integrase